MLEKVSFQHSQSFLLLNTSGRTTWEVFEKEILPSCTNSTVVIGHMGHLQAEENLIQRIMHLHKATVTSDNSASC